MSIYFILPTEIRNSMRDTDYKQDILEDILIKTNNEIYSLISDGYRMEEMDPKFYIGDSYIGEISSDVNNNNEISLNNDIDNLKTSNFYYEIYIDNLHRSYEIISINNNTIKLFENITVNAGSKYLIRPLIPKASELVKYKTLYNYMTEALLVDGISDSNNNLNTIRDIINNLETSFKLKQVRIVSKIIEETLETDSNNTITLTYKPLATVLVLKANTPIRPININYNTGEIYLKESGVYTIKYNITYKRNSIGVV